MDDKKPQFDPDLSPENEQNKDAAKARRLHYNKILRQYVDEDGCPTHDEFGQRL